jgi:hypothetical protein
LDGGQLSPGPEAFPLEIALERPVEPCPTEFAQLTAAGGDVTYIHLPDMGMLGNSHMFMQDNNNLQVADVIIQWINEHVDRRGR